MHPHRPVRATMQGNDEVAVRPPFHSLLFGWAATHLEPHAVLRNPQSGEKRPSGFRQSIG